MALSVVSGDQSEYAGPRVDVDGLKRTGLVSDICLIWTSEYSGSGSARELKMSYLFLVRCGRLLLYQKQETGLGVRKCSIDEFTTSQRW